MENLDPANNAPRHEFWKNLAVGSLLSAVLAGAGVVAYEANQVANVQPNVDLIYDGIVHPHGDQ